MPTELASHPEVAIGLDDVVEASRRLAPWIHRTPVLTCQAVDERSGGSVFLKCENFQKVGAFKIRGAMNALLQLDEARRGAGVVTHSSGNHAQALAQAGKWLGVPVRVVMPSTAPAVKRQATEGYGATVIPCEPTLAARESTVARIIAEHGCTLIHPFDDWRVIAGQGTAALELIEQAGPLDVVIAPVGGGGLLAGTAIATRGMSPGTRVIGAEPKAADDAFRSFQSGHLEPSHDPKTVADGLRTSLGQRPFAVIREHVDAIATASEAEILEALRFIWERVKILIEPSCAVPVATLFNGQVAARGLRVGVILTGGNVDLEPLFQAYAAKWL
jgi:threonine dehydratase